MPVGQTFRYAIELGIILIGWRFLSQFQADKVCAAMLHFGRGV